MALTRPKYSQIPDTDFKQSVRVATVTDVGNVMLAAMPNTVDGVSLNYYDRILVRTQANAAQNGIYYVKAVGTGSNGIWERTKDADAGSAEGKVTPAIITLVEEGTINSGRTFRLTTTGNIDLGTTNLSFGVQTAEPAGSTGQLQFANVNNVIGGATTTSYDYTTGNLTLTGNVNTTLLYQAGKRVPQIYTALTPPANPAVGDQWYQLGTDILYEWLSDGATQYWVDVTGATIANVNPITGETIGTLVVNGGQDSSSATTGALQVVGGVGISGNIFVGGNILTGSGSFGGQVSITANTPSTSETTGALIIPTPGGIGIGGNIWAGGAIVANSRIPSTSISTGAIRIPGVGGLGVGGNVWVGQDVNVVGNITGGGVRQTISSTAPANPTVGDQWYQLGTDILYQYVSDGTSKYWVDIAGATVANISAQSQQSLVDIQIVSGTPSTSASTGALTVSGGVGIQGNLNLQGGFNISGGNIVANQNVTSTNTTTGSMVITGQGGLGVGGNINVGQNVSVAGNLSIAQSASFLQNVTISANLVAGGTYFSAAGLSVTNGNIVTTGTSAQIGGLTITNGAISGLASLGVTGGATIGADLAVTGNITGGGLRKYAQVGAPTNPVVGDVWYKTDTDVYYTYVNDGTKNIWVDYTSASVSNANPTSPQSLSDLQIVSGTPSTSTSTGALQVTGGAGISGNVFTGNLSTSTVSATNFTFANGVSILAGNEGTYSNANVVAYLAASNISVGGNIVAGGTYFSAGGLSVTAGNIVATGARAVIGGLTIENGGISSLASLNVVGSGTLGGDFAITGNITAGGLRKYAQASAPTNPVVGDVWYKTDTDVFYQYVNDGTSRYWIDYTSATVSNASPTAPQSLSDLQIVSGTPSTSTTSGALQVTGGAGISGNINVGGNATVGNLSTTTVSAGAFTYANGVSILAGNEGTYSNANVTAYLTARTTTISDGFLSTAGLTVTAGNLKTTSANIGGLIIENGGLSSLASLGVVGSATIGGNLTVTGNITGGGLRKYAQINAPTSPVVGDVWYKTDTDVYYQYITDGTKNIWVDYSSATVSNASPTQPQSLQDLTIVSGTPSTSTTTGALIVTGGAGVSGNINAGNISAGTISAGLFTYANGVSILAGNEGTYSNANVTGYLAANGITVSSGNITATGTYLAAGGFTATAGNIRTTSANIGGVIIESGGIGQLASLGVVGAATIGGDVAITGNITAGGLRKYAQINAPTNPVVGDVWYKTDTDVYYQYITDGTKNIWVDYSSATVSNANPTSPQSLQDLQIVSGTSSTSTTSGALQVTGGAGISGNIYVGGNATVGNLSTGTITGTAFTYANGVSILAGNEGTYSNANVTAYLTARTTTISDGFLSTAGMTVTAGNLRTTSANIGGVIIESGGISSLASLNVLGAATIGGDLAVTGNITGGGIRKSSSVSAPANPVVGDQWYKTDTDTLYQYINDGTSKYWIDVAGATVSNASITSSQIAYDIVITTDTQTTSPTTGAIRVQGGIGLIGNIYTTGIADFGGNLTAGNIKANNNLQTNTLAVVQNATVGGTLNVTGAVSTGNLTTGNITGYGFTTAAGNLTATGQYFSAGGMSATAGNISVGNISGYGFTVSNGNVITTGTKAVIGGLTIQNGGFGSLASLDVTGAATFGANVDITGRVTGGGIRKTSSITAPASPTIGDTWYKTDTDTLYQYINDGTSNYWIDVSGATVANISPQTSQTLNDIVIVSGTPATNTTSGALQVQGGAGITGNVFTGNLSTTTVSASAFTFANGVSILAGNEGTYSNANVLSYLAANGITATSAGITTTGNITASGTYFSAAGLTVLNGNVTATGTTATIGGLVINNGALPSLPSLGVLGAATIGGDLAVTGNVTGGGLRKYAQINAPANPVVGDVWYKTDTDVYYQYINDGTSRYWIDYSSATVSNASPTSPQSLQDLSIVSGTPSVSTSTGALVVQGGAGISGNVFTGNLSTSTVAASNFTYANGVSILAGNEGTYSNANVTAYLTARTTTISDGYLSTAGISVTAGNILASSANIGGVIISNGGLSSLASLAITGAATIGGDLAVTGNITGGGIRKTTSISAPANPVVGDQWYKTDTDTLYQYINDGTSRYWIDVAGATVSNARTTGDQIAYDIVVTTDTQSTSPTTGAVRVQGGIGLIGNIYTTGIADFGGNLRAGNITANNNLQSNTLAVVNNATVGGSLTVTGALSSANLTTGNVTVGNISGYGFSTANGNVIATGQYFSAAGFISNGGNIYTTGSYARIGGLVIQNGGFGSLASLDVTGATTIGGDITATGNISAGGVRKYVQINAPANAIVGDQWYKTDTDTLYQYINDGTSKYWIDIAGATVANISPQTSQTLNDLVIVSGTPATNTTSGALQVQGGAGITGNVFTGNLSTTTVSATSFTYANGVSILVGNEGTYSNTNVAAYLSTATINTTGNIIGGGISITSGNILATSANIGGLIISGGGIASLASLGVTGNTTIGGNLTVTGNVSGGGLRKYAQVSKPTNAVPGDVWYKTDTDVYYTYVNDGTSSYWIDYVGATVSNAAVDNSVNHDFTIASGTPSTDPTNGALIVVGGVGVTGDINTTGDFTIDGTFTACTAVSAGYLNVADGIDSYGNVIIHGPGTENYTVQVRSSDAADNVLGIKTSAPGGGFSIDALNSELIGATPLGISANTFSIGIKNSVGTTVQADALRVAANGNVSIAKTISVGQHVEVTGNVSASNANFTKIVATTANFTTLNLSGTLTVPTLNVTTSIDAPGIRKYAQISAPANPSAGDVWYKTDSDVYYTYVNDGTNSYWIDYVGATVSNAALSAGTGNDYRITSGTASVDADTGALTVVGGAGITGNLNIGSIAKILGNLVADSRTPSTSKTTGAIVIPGIGGLGVGGAIYTGESANIGTTLNVGTALYVGTTANVAGNFNTSGNISVQGRADITGNLDVVGRITGGGIRKTSSITAPVNPVVGDVWYKTDTDVYYTYVNDGTNNYWIDYVGPTVSNAAVTAGSATDYQFTSGTPSTDPTNGAVTIAGGLGISGNLFSTGFADFGGNIRTNNLIANNNIQTNTLAVSGSGVVIGNITSGNLSTGIATIARADISGALTVGGDVTVTGNINAGGVRKYAQINAPANPIVGDVWYKTDTDVYYTYVNDGTNKYWIDYVGATVSNASPTSLQSIQDLAVVGGTASTNTSTGAIVVAGGVGISGNINAGNVSATNVSASLFTYANGVSILAGNEGTYSNANVIGYLSAQGITTPSGNLVSSGTYFSAAGLSVTNGNVVASGTTATIGGLVINNGSLPSLPSLGVTGSATIGADLAVTGNITGGGVRKTQSTTPPVNPTVGDLWYKTDTDVYYQYTSDGTNKYWIDYVGATVSNAAVSASTNNDYRIASGTASTNTDTGALTVVGGAGITGDVFIGGLINSAGNIVANSGTASTSTTTGAVVVRGGIGASGALWAGAGANIGTTLNVGSSALIGTSLNVGTSLAVGSTLNVSGLANVAGNFNTLGNISVAGRADITGDLAVTGNITGGGLRKYAQINAPANPVLGDVWYKTDTDVYYQYINDGTNYYWVDYIGATVSNATVNSNQIAYDIVVTTDTQTTSPTTGAIRVQGGIGLIGNIYTTGIADFGGNLTAGNIKANNNLQTNTLAVLQGANVGGAMTVGGTLNVTGALSSATLSTGNVTVGNITGYGFTTNNGTVNATGNLIASGTYFSAGGLSVTAGNITATGFSTSNGNLITTGSKAVVGGLTIENGGFNNLASLGVTGGATIGADLAVTGNITGGGLRKTQSTTPPANPVQGDVWYKTDTDVYYQYINDGTASYWIDYASATVANITQNAATVSDLQIVSGTPSTDYTNGALTVAGGVGVSGNINTSGNISAGNIATTKIVASAFTYANGVSILAGNEGTYSNANVTGYLTSQGVSTTGGNLVSTGTYLSAGGLTSLNGNITAYGFTVSNGNITSTGTRAVVGGLTIQNGGFSDLASLGVIGSVTIGGNLTVTGNITGGGIRKTTSINAPANPVVGDLWYKTDTDVLYQFVHDGTSNYWVDYSSASVANAQPTSQQSITDLILVSGTQSTSSSTGALQVAGGIGVTGNINSDGNIRAGNITASNTVRTSNFDASGTASIGTLSVSGLATITGNTTITGNLFSNGLSAVQGNVVATGTTATIGGLNIVAGNITGTNFNITNGNISASGSYFSAGGLSVTNGNLVATGTTATIGGLVISNGGFGAIASLGVTGGATIGADLAVTGNITGGGLRKTASTTAPVNPVLGDIWYKTDTDVYYQYISDGTSSFWVDYTSATVANITQNAATVSDLQIVSGTPSNSTATGALTVAGGIGVTGNVNIGGNISAGNLSADAVYTPTVRASSFTYPNGASILSGYYFGTYSNANIVSALAANGITATSAGITTTGNISASGNLTASGSYFSAGGLTVNNGNLVATGTTATIGGLTITNGGFGAIASLNVIGAATIGADLTVTGNVTGGGIRKTTSISAPVNPVVGDLWYKTDTDVLYQYLNDGASNVWIDFASATVANITAANAQYGTDVAFVSGTTSTSPTTGAVQIAGGLGIVGNINVTGGVTTASTLQAQALVSNTSITGATLSVTGDTTVGNLTTGNITGYGFTTNNGNVTATGRLTVGSLATVPGNLVATGSYFSAGGLSVTAGNIVGYGFTASNGNVIATGTYAQIGGLEIINGGFGSLSSLGVTGSATVGANLTVTGNIIAPGLRKTASITAPANPVLGDVWYKTDSDIYYQYITDGGSNFWVDFTSATVANITQNAATVSDLQIVSGTPSTSSSTGALTVAGGIGVVGDVNISSNVTVGNVIAGTVYTPTVRATAFTYPNGASILSGYYFGTYSNANVTGYLTAEGIGTTGGNLTASGSYFSAGGLTSTAGAISATSLATTGNIVSQGSYAKVGGLEIINGGFGSLASIGVIGGATIGGDIAITGNITAGGLRKYAQTSKPTNPVVGDVWYKTDTDVYYQYITDGTTNVWVDFVSATVANITAANAQYGSDVAFVSGTTSTSPVTGAVQIAGGLGIIGNINQAGSVTSSGTVQAQSIVSNSSITGATLSISGIAAMGNLTVANITGYGFTVSNGNVIASGRYFSAAGLTVDNGNITSTGTTATIGGLTIANGGFNAVNSINVTTNAVVGGNLTVTGNITGGGVRKTTSLTAPASPTVGDQWYKTDTDILYQYINDGTNTYWVDVASATVANITNNFDGLGDFTTIGNVIANGFVSDKYYYANGVSFVTTTVANTHNIIANITNGFNLGLDLTPTGVAPGNYGSAISIPTIVVDDKGRISSITSNAVSTTFGLTGNVGSSSISGGNTLVVVGTPNQISTTVTGNTISIGFTPNISFTDFTVTGNLIYQGGGIKTTTSPTPPAGPTNGDMWYQSGTDILYRYVNDGTNEYWLDLFSTPLRAILPSRDIGGGDGEVQFNDNGTFGANVNFAFDKTTGTLKVERFRITRTQSPATPTSPGVQGEITWDGQWMYVCVAPNSWVRAGLYTW